MTIWTSAARAMGGLLTAALLFAGLAQWDHAFAAPGCAKPPASSLVVDVRRTGAKGDGRTDDTAALQAAFDKVGGTGGTVLVPDGTYMVDAVSNERRLKIRKDTTLKLSPGAVIKAIPNGALNYSCSRSPTWRTSRSPAGRSRVTVRSTPTRRVNGAWAS